MLDVEVEFGTTAEITAEMVRAQLELLVRDEAFRSSKRSIAFLRYVVEQTLAGQADQIKERSIGIEVFGRDPSYDTNVDHVVRTAAAELRKRLATYYVDKSTTPSCGWRSCPALMCRVSRGWIWSCGDSCPRHAGRMPKPAEKRRIAFPEGRMEPGLARLDWARRDWARLGRVMPGRISPARIFCL